MNTDTRGYKTQFMSAKKAKKMQNLMMHVDVFRMFSRSLRYSRTSNDAVLESQTGHMECAMPTINVIVGT